MPARPDNKADASCASFNIVPTGRDFEGDVLIFILQRIQAHGVKGVIQDPTATKG